MKKKSEQIECILLSGVDERVTKSDAETICAFHEGWLVDMDEGRGEDCQLQVLKEEVISIKRASSASSSFSSKMPQVLRRTTCSSP